MAVVARSKLALGREAALKMGLLRSPTGASSLATGKLFIGPSAPFPIDRSSANYAPCRRLART